MICGIRVWSLPRVVMLGTCNRKQLQRNTEKWPYYQIITTRSIGSVFKVNSKLTVVENAVESKV